jgi:hypothetical protein
MILKLAYAISMLPLYPGSVGMDEKLGFVVLSTLHSVKYRPTAGIFSRDLLGDVGAHTRIILIGK